MATHTWEGREVVFVDFNILEGRAVRAAFAKDGETGSYACLVASARYIDGSPVFASVDEIEALPFRLQQRVFRLAAEAAKSNGMIDDDDRTSNLAPESPAGPSR